MEKMTDFGFEEVPVDRKQNNVKQVFNLVADKYGMMNNIMSLGTHILLKKILIRFANIKPGFTVLDLAGGTGDVTKIISDAIGPTGKVVLADINEAMLSIAKKRLKNSYANVEFLLENAESLSFEDNTFDAITIAYGIRNFTNKDCALAEAHRVLKPGGTLNILEFSQPQNECLSNAFKVYTSLWPTIGKVVAGNEKPYRYLRESILKHPRQNEFKQLIKSSGFEFVEYFDLMFGASAIHRAIK